MPLKVLWWSFIYLKIPSVSIKPKIYRNNYHFFILTAAFPHFASHITVKACTWCHPLRSSEFHCRPPKSCPQGEQSTWRLPKKKRYRRQKKTTKRTKQTNWMTQKELVCISNLKIKQISFEMFFYFLVDDAPLSPLSVVITSSPLTNGMNGDHPSPNKANETITSSIGDITIDSVRDHLNTTTSTLNSTGSTLNSTTTTLCSNITEEIVGECGHF